MRPAAHSLSFASPKESKQRKGDPAVRVPFAALRGNLRCSVTGRAAELTARCALRSNNCGKSVHEGWRPAAPARPAPCAPRHGQKGGGTTRAIAALGPDGRRRFAPRSARPRAAMARVGLFNPLGLRLGRGVCGVGMRVAARMLRALTCRSCLNGAPKARSEFCGTPRKRPDPGLPRSVAQGSQTVGRLSFGYFSLAKQRKVPRPPGRDPASRPQQSHSKSYQNNSYQRLPHKRKSPKTLNISTERNTSSAQPPAPGAGCGCPAPGAAESSAARSPPSPGHRPAPCGGPAPSH